MYPYCSGISALEKRYGQILSCSDIGVDKILVSSIGEKAHCCYMFFTSKCPRKYSVFASFKWTIIVGWAEGYYLLVCPVIGHADYNPIQ